MSAFSGGTASVPAGAELVMEVFTPNGETTGNLLFIGSNADPESAPSYLSAADCGITTPTTTAGIGFTHLLVHRAVYDDLNPARRHPARRGCRPTAYPTARDRDTKERRRQ